MLGLFCIKAKCRDAWTWGLWGIADYGRERLLLIADALVDASSGFPLNYPAESLDHGQATM